MNEVELLKKQIQEEVKEPEELTEEEVAVEVAEIEEVVEVDLPTKYGAFKLKAFKQTTTGEEHLALVKGKWNKNESVLVRVHSSCFTGDILGSLRCDCGDQLASAMTMINKAGKGVVL